MPMAKRMVREAGHRAFAAVLLRAVHDEGRKLGKMPEDCPIESTLPPSIIAKLSDELSAERVIASARAWVKSEAAKEIRA